MLYSIHHGGHMCHTPCGPSSPGLNSSQFSRTGLGAANWIENLEPRSTWYWTQRQMKSLKAIEVRRGWLSKPLVESSQGKSELGRRPRIGRQRSVGAQQIHSHSYPQILLSLSLTQMDLQFQLSCSHVKIFFVPNAELCPKDEVGGYCSNRKWRQMMQINIWDFSFWWRQSKENISIYSFCSFTILPSQSGVGQISKSALLFSFLALLLIFNRHASW